MEYLILVFVSLFALLISKCNKEVSHRTAPATFRLMLPFDPGARVDRFGPLRMVSSFETRCPVTEASSVLVLTLWNL